MKLKISGIVEESIVDGPGIRYVVFAQGCKHQCEGCHNPQTHDFNGGYEVSVDHIITELKNNPLIKGITLSGGDPFEQSIGFGVLAKKAKEEGYHVMTYSGYTFEAISQRAHRDPAWMMLAKHTDVLVDGKFEIEKCRLDLKFIGSSNQRFIDVLSSFKLETIVELNF